MTLFDWLNEITYNKSPWEKFTKEDQALFLPWMINRFISMNKNYVDMVNEVQQLNLPPDKLYAFYCQMIPKQKQFFKYIKGKKDKDDPTVDIMAKTFEISKREAKEYTITIPKEELTTLVRLHKEPYNNSVKKKWKLKTEKKKK